MHNKSSLKILQIILATLCFGTLAHTAMAQWQWVDKDGRKVFSDRSPPAEIAEKDILKKPLGATRAATAAAGAASAAPSSNKPGASASVPIAKASAPKLSGKDAELEARKKKADDEEAAKKKTEEDKTAKAKAENCERGKTGLATFHSGVQIASINANGEREIYDDTKRAAEVKRVREVIDSNCK